MATFPSYNPVYSVSKSSSPLTRVVQFGDGYEKRLLYGLNQDPKQYALTFSVSDDDADVIEAFLEARAADSVAFDWTPPDKSTSFKWVCSSWGREMFDFQRSKISATFRQVFEP